MAALALAAIRSASPGQTRPQIVRCAIIETGTDSDRLAHTIAQPTVG